MELKGQVDDDFLPYIFCLFDPLGVVKAEEFDRNTPQEAREARQYLTLESIQKNLPKVFGVKNDFFAEMLFNFISDHGPMENKINFHQFISRLKVFWPKKKTEEDINENAAAKEYRKRNHKQAKKNAMRKFIFAFIRHSGGN